MNLQGLSTHLQVYNSTVDSLTQAAIILVLGVAIVISNGIIIASYVNYRGK